MFHSWLLIFRRKSVDILSPGADTTNVLYHVYVGVYQVLAERQHSSGFPVSLGTRVQCWLRLRGPDAWGYQRIIRAFNDNIYC